MAQTTEERLRILEAMADQARLYMLVTRRLVMALGLEAVALDDEPLRMIDRLRLATLDPADDERPQAYRDQVEDYLAYLEAFAATLDPR